MKIHVIQKKKTKQNKKQQQQQTVIPFRVSIEHPSYNTWIYATFYPPMPMSLSVNMPQSVMICYK